MITLTITKLRDRIYKFNENGPDMNVDAFLVIGKNKGILIDGLMDAKGVLKEARKLTDLPLEMIITHGHPVPAFFTVRKKTLCLVPIPLVPEISGYGCLIVCLFLYSVKI